MSSTSNVAAAIAAGYLLGRTKKLRLAITVGSMLAGGRLTGAVRPSAVVGGLAGNPEVRRLQDQLRDQLFRAAKSAAIHLTTTRLESLNASLAGPQEQPSPDAEEDSEDDSAEAAQDDSAKSPTKRSRAESARSDSARSDSSRSKRSDATGADRAGARGGSRRTSSGGAKASRSGTKSAAGR